MKKFLLTGIASLALVSAEAKLSPWRSCSKTCSVCRGGDRVWVNGPDDFYLDGNREPTPNDPFIYTKKSGRYVFNLYEHGSGSPLPVFFQICAMKRD
jgi:hypothetical protein